MTFEFGDTSRISEILHRANMIAAIFSAAMIAGAVVLVSQREYLSFVVCVGLSVVGFFTVRSLISYPFREHYFNRVEITSGEVHLEFADGQHSVIVPRDEISLIQFGLPGKKSGSCYLRFELKSGDSYRSPTVPGIRCKEQRLQILGILKLPASVPNKTMEPTR